MPAKDYENNIRRIRIERGLTQEQLAQGCNTSKDQISKLERGQRNLTQHWLMELSHALQVDAAQLLPSATQAVHVVGYIGAGAEIIPFDDHAMGSGLYEVEPPSGINSHGLVAVEVRGDSMLPFIKEGWQLFYRKEHEGVPSQCIGQLCVINAEDGRMLVKEVRHGSKPHHYDLHSYNADLMPDIRLIWAAPIIDIRPKVYSY